MARIGLDSGSGMRHDVRHDVRRAGQDAVERAGAVRDEVREGVRRRAEGHARWIVRLARAGYAAKGTIFLLIGWLAVLAAAGDGGDTTDSRGALHVLGTSTMGRGVLVAMAIGLLGFAFWSFIAAALDAEDRGSDAKGIALRLGLAASGIAYAALGVEALRTVAHLASSGGNGARHWSARVMSLPWGRWLIAGVGVAVIGYALYQLWKGARKDLRKRLHLMGEDRAHRWVLRVARFGIMARAVVFALIGWFLVHAGLRRAPGEVGGIADALDALAAQSYGPLLLGTVAVGLMAYGIWELVNARYRDIPVS